MRQISVVSDIPIELSGRTRYAPILSLSSNNNSIPFSNAKTLLGQEFPYAIYDMRAENGVCLNLEALAIVVGTIQKNGTLFLVCPEWDNLETLIDFDSLRWNDGKAIASPNFYQYFKQLVLQFGFSIAANQHCRPHINIDMDGYTDPSLQQTQKLTADQQNIFENLPLADADIHLITAPRGRGKSTLSGKLAEKIAQTNSVLITARSHSALPNFWKNIESADIPFFAPDKLIQLIESQQISAKQWLFVDEAASLPLPMLHKFCSYFDKVVLTTTTQNYEGTGKGFSLKFLPQLTRSYQQWQLTQPLRWGEEDKLEQFINQLLILETALLFSKEGLGEIFQNNKIPLNPPFPKGEIDEKIPFYNLLASAHYKTTPTDLRRLFDAEQQQFYSITEDRKLAAVCWTMPEGGIDEDLTQAIWRGERRPQGSLVAQYLCFQGNLPEACRLRSVRISRIAVQPELQGKGYGKRLVQQIILQNISENSPLVDFISVSFGMSDTLSRFWQDCGFQLVQITPTVEASSGYPSAMMLYPLSAQGQIFVQQATYQFQRDNLLLQNHISLKKAKQMHIADLENYDLCNINGFIHAQRTFSACYASLKRLYWLYPKELDCLTEVFTQEVKTLPNYKKQWSNNLKETLKRIKLPNKSS
ncbi:tRNA cytosine(34) acetyltransferase TmcA [Pasteurellaceae bacterium 15-036681]|nr:tRNA cytosine(34) acetyltransferase TmcA [Pasteurellaceae bacterium 15-036681]